MYAIQEDRNFWGVYTVYTPTCSYSMHCCVDTGVVSSSQILREAEKKLFFFSGMATKRRGGVVRALPPRKKIFVKIYLSY